MLWKRPWLGSEALPDSVVRNDVVDLASTVAVFVIAVPLAFASPTVAKLWWLVLIPLKTAMGKRGKRLRAAGRR
ncbi:hypothetical protein ACFCYX_18700 [Streptomyces populi]|uniref:hypothetical protein n=1 Tax=Streptomyces populi TaxID=2058924 RepID=UPI001F0C4F1F|nr:hypothetical protein [Streptomyces populi]